MCTDASGSLWASWSFWSLRKLLGAFGSLLAISGHFWEPPGASGSLREPLGALRKPPDGTRAKQQGGVTKKRPPGGHKIGAKNVKADCRPSHFWLLFRGRKTVAVLGPFFF